MALIVMPGPLPCWLSTFPGFEPPPKATSSLYPVNRNGAPGLNLEHKGRAASLGWHA